MIGWFFVSGEAALVSWVPRHALLWHLVVVSALPKVAHISLFLQLWRVRILFPPHICLAFRCLKLGYTRTSVSRSICFSFCQFSVAVCSGLYGVFMLFLHVLYY